MTASATKSSQLSLRKWGGKMSKNSLIARSNIRNAKGQTVAIVVLVLLSSIMMNLWLMLSMDYRKNFDRCLDRLNDGHVTVAAYVTDEEFNKFIAETLEKRSDITEFTVGDAFCEPLSMDYNGGTISTLAVIMEKEDALSRDVGKVEITEDSDCKSGIYLPMLYGTGNNYKIGDTVKMTLLGEEAEYTLCGFFNSAMNGSQNCGMTALLLTEDKYEELSKKTIALKSSYFSVRVSDISKSEKISAEIKEAISKQFPQITVSSNDYQLVTTSRYISQNICAAVLSAMALLVLLIGIVVIASNIANYIQENMQNLGALKAIGYTSTQIIFSILMQFVGVSAAASVVGIALSYLVFPGINDMMVAQTGIPYTVRFQLLPVLFTMIFISAVVAAAVYFSARKIKKIEPIMAMRQGIATHSFKKNHIPLEKSSMSINTALAMKTTLSGFKQNLTVCITMLVVSLILVFSATLFKNAIMDSKALSEMIAGEYADSAINVNLNREEELVSKLENDDRVEKFYLFTSNNIEVQDMDGVSLVISAVSDCSKMNNQSMAIEGRFPKYDNEIAVAAKYAYGNGIKVGDEITLKVGNSEEKYIVSGYAQCTNSLGRDCIITRDGYERIGSLPNLTYYIDLTEGEDIDSFNDELSDYFGGDVNTVLNVGSILEAGTAVYAALMAMLVTAIVIISCIVIIFVLYLLVRNMLNKKKCDYGILKALGFTTGQLVLQTAISFMPSVIISSAIGIAISIPLINPLLSIFLSGIGIVKCTFIVPVHLCIVFGIALVLFAFGAACLMSVRVKKIVPRELLVGE